MKRIVSQFLMLCIFAVSACSNSSSDPEKDFFSLWIRNDHLVALNLHGLNFGQRAMPVRMFNGEVCATTVDLRGDQHSGSAYVWESYYIPGTGSGQNPGCNTLVMLLTYKKSKDTLNVCDHTGCAEYIHGGGESGAGRSVQSMSCTDTHPLRCPRHNICCGSEYPYHGSCNNYCYRYAVHALQACGDMYDYCY